MAEWRLKHFGWGREGEGMTAEEVAVALDRYRRLFGVERFDEAAPPALAEIELRPPRLLPPRTLAPHCSTETYDRVAHTYGKSFSDYARGLVGQYDNAPDVVAYPRDEAEVTAVVDWAGGAQAALIPFGAGSSVVGGVEPQLYGTSYRAAISLDLRHLDRVVEIDRTSRAARIEAGVFGPALEAQLKPHALTLRHFPQSFEYSTLGGWIATRSGGHFASLYTHIDDFVESLRVVTPRGLVETRRLPGSGAGPSPDRLFIGSEGILGVITEAWVRLQDRPRFRAGGAVRFVDFFAAARAVRAIAQAGLYPSNCRILDPQEAQNTGAGDGTAAITRSMPGSAGRWNAAPITVEPRNSPKRQMRIARVQRKCGGTPSSACPMPANTWSDARSSRTPSRRRSPGTASKRFTTRSRPRPRRQFARPRGNWDR
jgi:alkyldihydroxyacetonephosphate synthase